MLNKIIPDFDTGLAQLQELATSGLVLAFNVTWRGPEHVLSTFPAEWQEMYDARNYFAMDPVFIWITTHSGAIRWSDIRLPDMRGVLKAARTYGLCYGAVISTKQNGKRSFITMAREDREFTDPEIEAVAKTFESWADLVTGPDLSDGEKEVLRALVDGLSIKEIALQLGLSEPAIKQRVAKAISKLGAKSRTQAVAMAVSRKLLN